MSGPLGDVSDLISAINQRNDADDIVNNVAANPDQAGSALQTWYGMHGTTQAPPGVQYIHDQYVAKKAADSGLSIPEAATQVALANNDSAGVLSGRAGQALAQVGQDVASRKITPYQALAQINSFAPSMASSNDLINRQFNMNAVNPPSAQSNGMAQQAPALASMGGVQSAPVTPMNGNQGDSAPNLPVPSNVSGSGQYPGLSGANGLLQPRAALPVNSNPVAIGTSQVESGGRDYNPDGSIVTSPKGAQAAMQVMPSTQTNPGFGVTPAKDNSPAEIDRVGVDYRNALLKRYGGNQQLASAAYNAGPGTVDAALQQTGGDPNKAISLLPQETQAYVPKVTAATNAAQQVSPTNPTSQYLQNLQAQGGMGGSPLQAMELQSTMAKNAAETAKDAAQAGEATEAQNTARWNRGEAVNGIPAAPQGGEGTTGGVPQPAPAAGSVQTAGQPTLGGKAAQEVAQKEAEEEATNRVAAQKNAALMLSNLPIMNSQFDKLRDANSKSSFSPVNDEEGNGIITTLHGMGGKGNVWSGTEGDKTAQANATVKTLAAQNVIREIAPQLSQNGIKGNKFLETLINSASGVDLNTGKGARSAQVDLLQNNYNQGLKSVLQQVKSLGGDPTALIHQAFPDGKGLGDAVKRGAIDKDDALNVYRQYHGAQ